MVPDHSFLSELSSCSVSKVPEGFYDRVEEGSIKLIKKRILDSLKKEFLTGSDEYSALLLYRECIHPRIPQLAIIGFSESVSNLYTSEIKCRWLGELLDETFKVPNIKIMEKDIAEWDKYKKRYSYLNNYRDMGWNPKRKKGILAEWFHPYGPMDYAG
uniref:Probable flavin-containing monooxygenase 1 n=1 Tax=Nicotiana tabacum TaxID=4097 RepID=A0A1S3YS41_TOBAC|nr:PREDICTED: probable flavin-containing monooxygenase 1 [Nicotiana tabacum]